MTPLDTNKGEPMKTLPEILKPYFAYEWEMCVLCGHQRDCHWWNGAGNPDNAGWDACKYHKCECKGAFDKQGYLKTFTEVRYEKQLPDATEAIAKELMGIIGEDEVFTKVNKKYLTRTERTKVTRNVLRAEQRARLTAFIGKEK